MDGNLLFSPHPKHHFAPYPQIQRIFKYCSSIKPFRDAMSQGCIRTVFFLDQLQKGLGGGDANVIGAPKIPDIFWKPFPKCTVLLSEFRWQIGLNFLQHIYNRFFDTVCHSSLALPWIYTKTTPQQKQTMQTIKPPKWNANDDDSDDSD